jgi:predicted N-formylglutamate amidohydrolase
MDKNRKWDVSILHSKNFNYPTTLLYKLQRRLEEVEIDQNEKYYRQ